MANGSASPKGSCSCRKRSKTGDAPRRYRSSFEALLERWPTSVGGFNLDKSGRIQRRESERFRSFSHKELTKPDKLNLDIFWPQEESLEDNVNLPDPDIIAQKIVEDLEAALSQFAEIGSDLKR